MIHRIADMFINYIALRSDMRVAVMKAIGPKELAMASRGITPPDLGGGMFGSRGVPRGYPDPEGTGMGGVGRTPASEKYYERMRGGADVPAHQMAREAEGRPPIPHSGREPKARGGGGLMGAMRRLGVPSRQFFPGTSPDVQGGIAPGMKTGTLTAQIPGRVEAAPHEHRHAEMAEGGDADDILDNLAESFKQRNDEPSNPFAQTSRRAEMRAPARVGVRGRADAPQSTGSRQRQA